MRDYYDSDGPAPITFVTYGGAWVAPIGLCILVAGCSQAPIVRIQYVQTPVYIPIPATLTQPISVDLTGATWGSAVGSLNAGLETCNSQLQAISTLKPSPPR